jgi:hypothetical protein
MNADSLAYEVQKTITSGITNIQNRAAQAFTQTDTTLFTNTSLPLYKVARISAMDNDMTLGSDYSEIIAIDLAYKWMMSALQNLRSIMASSGTSAQSADVIQASEKLTASIDKQIEIATLEYQAAYKKVTADANLQQNLKLINDQMTAALMPSIQNSVMKFSKH